uniref:UBC core domain-containing protein n=1 Tax=Bracon brevicornis TaxID=1563983 RepID=A0A6V7HZC2_9HYME
MEIANRRLKKELIGLSSRPPEGISCYQKENRINSLIATISGPQGTPYEGGLFDIQVDVDERYPFHPPTLKFLTPVYHPNIDTAGRICMDLLKISPKQGHEGWKPTVTLEILLVAVRLLLKDPNPDDPLMPDIANEYRLNRSVFDKKAKKFTTVHAK